MKTRFNTFDIVCGVTELQQKLIGLRVQQVYDIDNKTYLIRFQNPNEKCVLLLESGIRFHTTAFEWPKNAAPSGFTMKLRKHLKNKRLESFQQLGIDRIVDLQFGSGEVAYHVILELYDRGNIILTDHELTILNILRPHVEGEEVRFAVREKYPTNRAKSTSELISEEQLKNVLKGAKPGDNLKKLLVPVLDCGPSVLEHVLFRNDLINCVIGGEVTDLVPQEETNKKNRKQRKKTTINERKFNLEVDFEKLQTALREAEEIMANAKKSISKGFIIQKAELKPSDNGQSEEYFYHNVEYHPYLFVQFEEQPFKEFETFMAAVDEFYSTLEGQKIDLKTIQQEREALKKLSNVKKDHAKRLEELNKVQEKDKQKAELITRNRELVDSAILAIQSAIANQMSWPDINELVKAAQANNDPVATAIKQLKLEINHIALYLKDPYDDGDSENEENKDCLSPMIVDVDLALSAFANARKYYDQKRSAAKKEQRTIDASEKALKSAEKKTQQTLKEVRTISTISKARKVYWFEKFYWFISSENYLVIGGRDSQQNELIVKRYMRPTDIYVHAEIQGASSVVIKNPTGQEIPPKTLLEAGTMAISYSVAWDAKVVTNAYWVKSEQVSKKAPTGEYLGTGSFMIRGKKNFLPPCHLIMGLSILFKLEESSLERHLGERRVKSLDESMEDKNTSIMQVENEKLDSIVEEEIELVDSDKEEKDEENDNNDEEKISGEDNDDDDGNEKKSNIVISEFPDTQIEIDHSTIQTTTNNDNFHAKVDNENPEEESYIIPALPPRQKQQSKSSKSKKAKGKQDFTKEQHEPKQQKEDDKKGLQMKRGQRSKLKKMKTKYKDQDEEERQLRMQILQSAGPEKRSETKKPDNETADRKTPKIPKQQEKQEKQEVDDVDDVSPNVDVDMLNSLTGCPVEEDELLFAIPVVAPYQALQNYKYKVKLTPGTGKRGKAAKTALLMFTKDKLCTSREKDLLKSIKEEILARNIPGKVKVSAPFLQKFQRK